MQSESSSRYWISALSRWASASLTFDLRRPAVKIGCVTCGTRAPHAAGSAEKARQLRALPAQESAQADLRKIGGLRDADLGVGGDQILLRRANVRPALPSNAEGKPAGTSGGSSCSVRLRPRTTSPGFFPSSRLIWFSVCSICCCSSGNRFRGGAHQLFALAQIEQRGDAAALPVLDQPQRFLAGAQRLAWRSPVRSPARAG